MPGLLDDVRRRLTETARGEGFHKVVREALSRSGLPARNLWLEVTESSMIDDPEQTLRTLEQLADLEVRVALDDFGTGYSSLSLLQRFPLQRIKIDRAFVNNVATTTATAHLVRTILAMGESLGLEVVAEGVETIEQLAVLAELGCTHVQGYLVGRPVHANAMRSTLSALAEVRNITSIHRQGVPPSPIPRVVDRGPRSGLRSRPNGPTPEERLIVEVETQGEGVDVETPLELGGRVVRRLDHREEFEATRLGGLGDRFERAMEILERAAVGEEQLDHRLGLQRRRGDGRPSHVRSAVSPATVMR